MVMFFFWLQTLDRLNTETSSEAKILVVSLILRKIVITSSSAVLLLCPAGLKWPSVAFFHGSYEDRLLRNFWTELVAETQLNEVFRPLIQLWFESL